MLLELSKLSSCSFSQSGNNFSLAVMMLLTSVSEKQRTNISTDRSGMAPKSAFWFGSSTYRLYRYRCHMITGFRYPTLVERWCCYLFRLYIFTLLNRLDNILVNILYCSFIYNNILYIENHWPKARSTSIAFAIKRLSTPDLSVFLFKTFVSHLFGSTVFSDLYFI